MKLKKTIILLGTNFYLNIPVSSMALIWSMKDTMLTRELAAALHIHKIYWQNTWRFPLRELFSWRISQGTCKAVENFWILWTVPLTSSKATATGLKIHNILKSAKSPQGPVKKVFSVKHIPCIAYFLLKWTRQTHC